MLQVINAIDESEPGFSLAQMRLGSVFAKVAYQFLLPLEHFFVERPAQHFRVCQNLMQFNLESRGLQQWPMIAQRRSVAGWGEVALPIGEGEPRAGFQDASGFSKTAALVGNCPYHVNADCSVESRGIETGRIEPSRPVGDGVTDPVMLRPLARLL